MHVSVVAQADVGGRTLHGEREPALNCMSLLPAWTRKNRPLNRHGRHARIVAYIPYWPRRLVRSIGMADARSELREFVSGFEEGESPAQPAWPIHAEWNTRIEGIERLIIWQQRQNPGLIQTP
jgi:hypothetical protein